MKLKGLWSGYHKRIVALLMLSALALGATLATSGTAQAATAPTISSLGCPASVQEGQAVTCTPSISGAVTRYRWNAFGGTPGTGNGTTFTTTFNFPGAGFVRLEACNGTDCTTRFVTIRIQRQPAPVIDALNCPASAAVGVPVFCDPDVAGNVTLWRWTAFGGTPFRGNAETFSTVFSQVTSVTVRLTACNSGGCSNRSMIIAITVGDD